ncbi:AMP-binding protein [Neobacillus dielmonensis]|uniref:AMP-binding protein n=1 Tax=Neobacillus dielmonensis TaxID=1347369 RepID=UPI0005A83447|nr:AMP-binding protein [Neobacillus dielmonensis]
MTTTSLQMSRQLLVSELIRRAAHKTPNQVAFIYGNRRITYLELENRILQLAGWLQQQNMQIGDKVGIIFKNNLAFVEVMFGTAAAGCVNVPINFRLSPQQT